MHYKAIIIGAGPAGLMAARELKKKNIDFIVIDPKKEIGLPLSCGEGIRESEFIGFFKTKNYPFVKNTISHHEIRCEKLTRTFKANFLELDRQGFEQWLASPVKKHIKLKTRCEDLMVNKDRVEILTNKGIFTSDIAILCYGCNFKIQKKLNLTKKGPAIFLGYGGLFKNRNLDPKKFYYFFDKEYPGYLWVFPKNNKIANIGFGGIGIRKNIKNIFNNLIKKFNLDVKQISEYAGIVPCSGPIEKTYSDRLLICGNAAGQVYAGTGEGIYFALRSGQLASKTAINAIIKNKYNSSFLKQYEITWKKDFGNSMKAGIIFANLLTFGFRYNQLKKLLNSPTKKEIRQMILEGRIPFRARLLWIIIRYCKLLTNKSNKLQLKAKILYNIYKIISKLDYKIKDFIS
jgi:digeranylgeranylglycerophospholipid reductase